MLRRLRRRGGGTIVRKIETPHDLQLSISSNTWHWDAMVSISSNDLQFNDSIKFYSYSSYPDLAGLQNTITGNLQDIFQNNEWHVDNTNNYAYWFYCLYYAENNDKIGVICFYLGNNGKRIFDNMSTIADYNILEGTFFYSSNGIHAYNIRVIPLRHSATDSISIDSRLTRLSLTANANCGPAAKSADKRLLSEWGPNQTRMVTYVYTPIGFYGNPAINHAFVTYKGGQIGYPEWNSDAYVTSSRLLDSTPCTYTKFNW